MSRSPLLSSMLLLCAGCAFDFDRAVPADGTTAWTATCAGQAKVARAHCLKGVTFEVDRRGFVGPTATCHEGRAIGGGCDCDESAITDSHTLEPDQPGWSCGCADKAMPTSYVLCVPTAAWAELEVDFASRDQMGGSMIASGGCVDPAGPGISAALNDPVTRKWRCAPTSYEPLVTFLAAEGE